MSLWPRGECELKIEQLPICRTGSTANIAGEEMTARRDLSMHSTDLAGRSNGKKVAADFLKAKSTGPEFGGAKAGCTRDGTGDLSQGIASVK